MTKFIRISAGFILLAVIGVVGISVFMNYRDKQEIKQATAQIAMYREQLQLKGNNSVKQASAGNIMSLDSEVFYEINEYALAFCYESVTGITGLFININNASVGRCELIAIGPWNDYLIYSVKLRDEVAVEDHGRIKNMDDIKALINKYADYI